MGTDKKQEKYIHKIGIYLWIWTLLFVLVSFSYMVDYMELSRTIKMVFNCIFYVSKAGFIMAIFMHLYWERWAIVNVLLWPMTAIGVFIAIMVSRILLYFFSRMFYFVVGS